MVGASARASEQAARAARPSSGGSIGREGGVLRSPWSAPRWLAQREGKAASPGPLAEHAPRELAVPEARAEHVGSAGAGGRAHREGEGEPARGRWVVEASAGSASPPEERGGVVVAEPREDPIGEGARLGASMASRSAPVERAEGVAERARAGDEDALVAEGRARLADAVFPAGVAVWIGRGPSRATRTTTRQSTRTIVGWDGHDDTSGDLHDRRLGRARRHVSRPARSSC